MGWTRKDLAHVKRLLKNRTQKHIPLADRTTKFHHGDFFVKESIESLMHLVTLRECELEVANLRIERFRKNLDFYLAEVVRLTARLRDFRDASKKRPHYSRSKRNIERRARS